MIFTHRVQDLRKQQNLSVKEFAQNFHVTPRTVQRWESGERVPPVEVIIELAKFFNVTTDYLLGLEN
mgnify:CR=1 FL=1